MKDKKTTKKRFTFADAKARIVELEDALSSVEFNDNVFTKAEVSKLKRRGWVSFLAGLVIGVFGYIGFFAATTEQATVIMEAAGTELLAGSLETPDVAHPAAGDFTIVATEGGMRSINFGEGFSIAHAPDPHVRVNGKVIAKVVNYEGAQSYPIPNFIAEDITSVTVWCEIADISLGNGVIMTETMTHEAMNGMIEIQVTTDVDMDMEMDSMTASDTMMK